MRNPLGPREMKLITVGDYGILETSGRLWHEQRKFTMQTFKAFGMGKTEMAERVTAFIATERLLGSDPAGDGSDRGEVHGVRDVWSCC